MQWKSNVKNYSYSGIIAILMKFRKIYSQVNIIMSRFFIWPEFHSLSNSRFGNDVMLIEHYYQRFC